VAQGVDPEFTSSTAKKRKKEKISNNPLYIL
jgi:hypothetical protein